MIGGLFMAGRLCEGTAGFGICLTEDEEDGFVEEGECCEVAGMLARCLEDEGEFGAESV